MTRPARRPAGTHSHAHSRTERRRQTEARILAAAREKFAEVGYDRTTIRAVAAAASVDPALVMQYFGSKDELFRQAIHVPPDEALPADPTKLTELLLSVAGIKLGEPAQSSLPLLRSMLTHPEATERLRAAQARQVEQAGAAIGAEDAELRAALLVAILFGVSVERNLIGLEPLRGATPDQITSLLRPCFQALTDSKAERSHRLSGRSGWPEV